MNLVSTAAFPVGIQGVPNVTAMFQWQFRVYQMSLCLLMGIWGIPGITTGFQWEFRVYWVSLWGSSWNLGLYPVSPWGSSGKGGCAWCHCEIPSPTD